MNKRFYILYGWLLTLFFTGCIFEEIEDCEEDTCIRFSFVYDYNIDKTDLFAEQVDHITLFIYTEEGRLEQTHEIYREEMEGRHTVSLMLPPGRHTAVAWGNCHTDHYQISNPETTSTHQLEMSCIENHIMTRANPGTLFHASNTFDVIQNSEYTVPMSMVKNSNTVKVIVKGLSKEDQEIAESLFVFRLVSNNWRYKYDNSVNSEQSITYLPEYNPEYYDDGQNIAATFYPLRLFTYDEETILTLHYRDPQTGREAAIEKPLVPYLISQAEQLQAGSTNKDDENEYLDRNDTYEIIFILDINTNGEISIDEWDRITKPSELGS